MIFQRQGLCEVSRYGKDPQCLSRPVYVTCVRSAHSGEVHEDIDLVCRRHTARILRRKRELYQQYGLVVPLVWVKERGKL